MGVCRSVFRQTTKNSCRHLQPVEARLKTAPAAKIPPALVISAIYMDQVRATSPKGRVRRYSAHRLRNAITVASSLCSAIEAMGVGSGSQTTYDLTPRAVPTQPIIWSLLVSTVIVLVQIQVFATLVPENAAARASHKQAHGARSVLPQVITSTASIIVLHLDIVSL